jgi:hypothetical protein
MNRIRQTELDHHMQISLLTGPKGQKFQVAQRCTVALISGTEPQQMSARLRFAVAFRSSSHDW